MFSSRNKYKLDNLSLVPGNNPMSLFRLSMICYIYIQANVLLFFNAKDRSNQRGVLFFLFDYIMLSTIFYFHKKYILADLL